MVKMPRFETSCFQTGVKTYVTETGQQLPPSNVTLVTRVGVGYDPSQNAENPIKAEDRKHPQINEDVTAPTMFLCAMASMVI